MNSSLCFPSLRPNFSNELWFSTSSNTTVPDEAQLTKEEEEYKEKLDAEVKQGQEIVPFGQTKQKNDEIVDEEEELEEEDDSNEEMDEDTDEFDTGSNGIDSIEEDMSGMNETSEGW